MLTASDATADGGRRPQLRDCREARERPEVERADEEDRERRQREVGRVGVRGQRDGERGHEADEQPSRPEALHQPAQRERHRHRAHALHRDEDRRPDVGVQHLLGHGGHERDERRGEERVEAHRHRVDAEPGLAAHEAEAFDDGVEQLLVARVRTRFRQHEREQHRDHREEAHRVDRLRPGVPADRDHDARERRPDDAAEVVLRRRRARSRRGDPRRARGRGGSPGTRESRGPRKCRCRTR